MKKLLKRLRYFKLQDLIAPFIFLIMILPSLIFRLINKIKNRHLWLICEDGNTARDNGYHFFKYVRNEHPNDYCFYVIDKNSKEYEKVKKYENIIQFKSVKHWLYYMSAEYNISIHKHGNPCQSFFFIIHVIFNLYNNRVFLQHGIIKDNIEYIHYKNAKFKIFICGAKKEYEYVSSTYGYPEGSVVYTGLARFDELHDNKTNIDQILIMPTWRNWLGGNRTNKTEFINSDYYKKWQSILNNQKLIKYLDSQNKIIYFYVHQHAQKYIDLFKTKSDRIKIIDNSTLDIQYLLKTSSLLVTDYSSVFMDFAYMKKPVIYYQFDYKKFRNEHLKEGYWSYEKDGFGPIYEKEDKLIDSIINIESINWSKYRSRIDSFFERNDKKNCERIYDILIK